jgi:ribonuclease T1
MVRVAPALSVSRNNPPERRMHAAAGAALRATLGKFVAVVFGLSIALFASGADARSSLGTIHAADLPEQGRQVLAAIHAGGPFAFKRDGIVFGNREGVLPKHPRGYYAEYTVPTPGERTRGARRIIAGSGTTGDFRTSDEYYYTNDHYENFRRIVP